MIPLETNKTDNRNIRAILVASIVWTLLITSYFYIFGTDSYIMIHDNGDANLPKIGYYVHNINGAFTENWYNGFLLGLPSSFSYNGHFNGFASLTYLLGSPFVANIILMILQRFIATFFTFLLLYKRVNINMYVAFAAGMMFSLNANPQEYVIYHLLSTPSLPLFILALLWVTKLKNYILYMLICISMGVYLAFFGSVIYLPQMFIVVLFWIVLIERKPFLPAILSLVYVGIGVLIVTIPFLPSTTALSGISYRTATVEHTSTIGTMIAKIINHLWHYFRADMLLVYSLFLIILGLLTRPWKNKKHLFIYIGYITFTFLVELSTFADLIASGYQLSRFYFFVSFWSAAAVAVAADRLLIILRTMKSPLKLISITTLMLLFVNMLLILFSFVSFYGVMRVLQIESGSSGLLSSKIFAMGAVLVLLVITSLYCVYMLTIKRNMLLYSGVLLVLFLMIPLSMGVKRIVINSSDALAGEERFSRYFDNRVYWDAREEFSKENLFRVVSVANRKNVSLHPGYPIYYGLETADAYMNLYPKKYHEIWGQVIRNALKGNKELADYYREYGQRLYLYNPHDSKNDLVDTLAFDTYYDTEVLAMLGVRYVFTTVPLNSTCYSYSDSSDGIYVYESVKYFPRAYFVTGVKNVSKEEDIYTLLGDAEYKELTENIYLSDPDITEADPVGDNQCVVEVVDYTNNSLAVKAVTAHEGYLIVTQGNVGEWQAVVDGETTDIVLANGYFIGVKLSEGTHEITLHQAM